MKKKDPHAKREAEKYAHPIPSREIILELLEQQGIPLSFRKVAKQLAISDERDSEALRRRLKAMVRDGQLVCNSRNHYGLLAKMDLVTGRVIGHPSGFGFLVPDEGGDDLFLSEKEMKALMHGDRITARVSGVDRKGRREGAVVEVLDRSTEQLVGRLQVKGSMAYVVPENKRLNQDVIVPAENCGDAKHGQVVVIALIEYPTKYRQPVGKVVEILGDHMAPGMEIEIALRDYDLPEVWPKAVEKAIVNFTPEVPEADKAGRVDLRDTPLVTIDGEDARDFDDAVYCERDGDGWKLLVAIADVAHYVKRGSALCDEAINRGNSVYFPGRVIPMLPEVLSNGLCSINPDIDRLCMVCEMQVNANGVVTGHRFFEGLMRSHARLTYSKVAAMLVEDDHALQAEYADVLPHLHELYALYQAMLVQRSARGAIEFDTTETMILFGEDKKIDCIVPVIRNDAHRLIEEFMIAANVSAANYLAKHKMPTLYRIHDGPKEQKLQDLRSFLAELGLSLAGADKPAAKDYQQLLASVSDRPDWHLIQTVMLRSMNQAVYSPDNIGHFGLAHEAYAHFTSPIRRYPDLLVHRAIKHVLAGKKAEKFSYTADDMDELGVQCSMTERRADEATREVTSWLKCEYMVDRVGESYAGVVTSVTGFGLFVELNDIYVEGLVHITALNNDYYHFDAAKHRLSGERTGKSYRLGDTIKVVVARVDLDERKIDFTLDEVAE